MLEIVWEALLDTARLLPFLYLTYLAMEALEHRLSVRTGTILRRAGRLGPLWGGLLGAVPQCGFSAAASSLYAGRVVSLGTLLAVFLSTSDEMLPILLSRGAPAGLIFRILGLKVLIGAAAGLLADGVCRLLGWSRGGSVHQLCQDAGCRCGHGNIFGSALRHTLSITAFLLPLTLALNAALDWIGEDALTSLLLGRPVLGVFLAGLVGLIPNCAASVAITTLYLDGLLSFGGMMAGLLVGAGVGLLVLARVNRRPKENLGIVLLLYTTGVVCGGLLELLG
ncbi:MAG: arsenic efflux protein [Oscillospiraceae bacterium]|nr:arsenic efflux protein [Oscillospiraceae bacterium]